MDNTLRELQEVLEKELKKISNKNDITPAELENATKAVCLLEKIKMLEKFDADEYSDNGDNWYSENSYRPGRSMVTGRFTSRDYDPRMHSRNGYSGHSIKDRMISKLEEMFDEAKTDHERQTVNEWITRLSNNN